MPPGVCLTAPRGRKFQNFSKTGPGTRVTPLHADSTALLTKWGSFGTGDGQFQAPQTVAVDGADIYVTDLSNHRLQKFACL
jgi:hypothetical protein